MGLLDRLLGRQNRPKMGVLYQAIVDRARALHWYEAGGVPDTIDGRFDMVVAILCAVLLRLEALGASAESAALTEMFIADMDGQLRESGFGDVGIGKRVGEMISMLGGRLGAYRGGLAAGDVRPALARNLFRAQPVTPAALDHVAGAFSAFAGALGACALPALLVGELP